MDALRFLSFCGQQNQQFELSNDTVMNRFYFASNKESSQNCMLVLRVAKRPISWERILDAADCLHTVAYKMSCLTFQMTP